MVMSLGALPWEGINMVLAEPQPRSGFLSHPVTSPSHTHSHRVICHDVMQSRGALARAGAMQFELSASKAVS